MKAKKKRVIPGFGLSMGVTITILSLVVLIPLGSSVFRACDGQKSTETQV